MEKEECASSQANDNVLIFRHDLFNITKNLPTFRMKNVSRCLCYGREDFTSESIAALLACIHLRSLFSSCCIHFCFSRPPSSVAFLPFLSVRHLSTYFLPFFESWFPHFYRKILILLYVLCSIRKLVKRLNGTMSGLFLIQELLLVI